MQTNQDSDWEGPVFGEKAPSPLESLDPVIAESAQLLIDNCTDVEADVIARLLLQKTPVFTLSMLALTPKQIKALQLYIRELELQYKTVMSQSGHMQLDTDTAGQLIKLRAWVELLRYLTQLYIPTPTPTEV